MQYNSKFVNFSRNKIGLIVELLPYPMLFKFVNIYDKQHK